MARSSVGITEGAGKNIAMEDDGSGFKMQVAIIGIPNTNSMAYADGDSGAGTVLQLAHLLMVPGAGGPSVNPGDVTNGLWVNAKATPAAARTSDAVAAAIQGDAIMNGFTPLTPKIAKATIAASTTDGAIVAAVSGKIIKPLAIIITHSTTPSTITFRSKPAGAGSDISPLFTPGANAVWGVGKSEMGIPFGWTVAGEGLSASTGAGGNTGVAVLYVEW